MTQRDKDRGKPCRLSNESTVDRSMMNTFLCVHISLLAIPREGATGSRPMPSHRDHIFAHAVHPMHVKCTALGILLHPRVGHLLSRIVYLISGILILPPSKVGYRDI